MYLLKVMAKYLQGKYVPKNPQKYAGDVNSIQFRSSWERKLFIFLDMNPGILKWQSEETVIPYVSPVDNRPHRYFVDCTVLYKTKAGEIKRALIEVKPDIQTKQPKMTSKRQSKRYLTEMTTFLVNTAKWEAATKWCEKNNFDFMILTEHHLGIK